MAGLDVVGRLVELGGGLVRISAINTARGVQGRVNWADGVISLDHLEEALGTAGRRAGRAWRILICHHPLLEPGHSRIAVDTRRGGEALRRCAAARVDAILTGHIHDAFAHPIEFGRRPMVQMGDRHAVHPPARHAAKLLRHHDRRRAHGAGDLSPSTATGSRFTATTIPLAFEGWNPVPGRPLISGS